MQIKKIIPLFMITLLLACTDNSDNNGGYDNALIAVNVTDSVEQISQWQAQDHSKGAIAPKVDIIEYSDFQCPFCARINPILKQIAQEYPADVRISFRHFPLSYHRNSLAAAEATEAAAAQGEFWAFHDQLFNSVDLWQDKSTSNAINYFTSIAEDLGLNTQLFKQQLTERSFQKAVSQSYYQGLKAGVDGTPYFIINGKKLTSSSGTLEGWRDIIEGQILAYDNPTAPEFTLNTNENYLALVKMNSGEEFLIKLFADLAPQTVNNFIYLSEQGFYNGLSFYYVDHSSIALTGDPTHSSLGNLGYGIELETSNAHSHKSKGLVVMANNGDDTTSNKWYITYAMSQAEAEKLDGQHTIIGAVIKNFDVIEKLTEIERAEHDDDFYGDSIATITIEHYSSFY